MAKTAKKTEPQAIASTQVLTVPLHMLTLSDLNVRKVTPTDEEIDTLAESIHANGLLQNLIVIPLRAKNAAGNPQEGHYEVVAGGRRWSALDRLAARERIPHPYDVPCVIATEAEAVALSLTENDQREPLHPVDEALAFAELVNQKRKPAAIAVLFGVSKRYVEQRLKLAAIHSGILAACRAGKLELETLQAFTVCDDPFKQFDVFVELGGKEIGPDDEMDPDDVRDALLSEAMEDDHRLVKFIGLDAYRNAGGTFLTDMFSDDDQPTLLADAALVRRLTEKRLRAAAKKVNGWAWVDTSTENWPDREDYERVSPVGDEFTAEELTHVGALVMVNGAGEIYTLTGFIRGKDSDAFERFQDEIIQKNNKTATTEVPSLQEDHKAPFPAHNMPTQQTDKEKYHALTMKHATVLAKCAVARLKIRNVSAAIEMDASGLAGTVRDVLREISEILNEIGMDE